MLGVAKHRAETNRDWRLPLRYYRYRVELFWAQLRSKRFARRHGWR